MGHRFWSCSAIVATGVTLVASPALAQQTHPCGFPAGVPEIKPTIHSFLRFPATDRGFACQMWQAFIFLNWPALPGQRGEPNRNNKARFGNRDTTVWETYKTADQVFLPSGQNPGEWSAPPPITPRGFARLVADGQLRHLTVESKVSREVLVNILPRDSASRGVLQDITQVGEGVLYDLTNNPVFYEVAMNQDHFQYIARNKLYNVEGQIAFRQTIILPIGESSYGQTGAIAVKAAWKILSAAESKSGRFHTAQALIRNTRRPITVGLVGFHIFQPLPGFWQGVWATFAQVDNAPVEGQPVKGSYNFYNPGCVACPINVASRKPGQVKQMFPDHDAAIGINKFMQEAIEKYDPTAPWQYYKLAAVQWPTVAVDISKLSPPVQAPLPSGKPNKKQASNAVLETFVQKSDTNCLDCHVIATTADRRN